MFRRLQAIQTPINVNRQGHRDHVGPDINLYYANEYYSFDIGGTIPGFYQLTATPYGTYSPSDSENLLNTDNIANHTGIGTFSETISTPLQVGINWYPAQLQPDHLYSHYVLTVERKTFNQGKNVDIGVTQNVVQGPSTISSNAPSGFDAGDEWQPFEIRDGNEPFWTYADNQPQKYIHNFTNVDLIDEGFLYYSILFYPDWDGSYHGPYGLNGFQKIFRSFIWMINDDLSEQDEDFYVRLRGIKKDTNFAPEGGPEQVNIFPGENFPYRNNLNVSEYPDFITNQDQSRIPESVILSETILRIDGTSSTANPNVGINSLYYSEYEGVIGLSPNLDADHFSDPNNRERDRFNTVTNEFEDFFEGRPGNSGWDYPQMIWAPIINQPYTYDDREFADDPTPDITYNSDVNYFGMTTETAGVNSPIGPFCGYYTACTFISTYTANELRTAGMTTGSILQGVTYDVVQGMDKFGDSYNNEKPINPFLSIVNVEETTQTNNGTVDILSSSLQIKAHNYHHQRINGETFPLGMNIYDPYDVSTNPYTPKKFTKFDSVGQERFAVGGTQRTDQDKYIWNGKDAIAIIASYDYQYGHSGSSNPFGPSNFRIGGDDDGGDLEPALVRMAKTYLNGRYGHGSLAYIFPDDTTGESNYFTASAKDMWLYESAGGYNNDAGRPSFTSPTTYPGNRSFSFSGATVNHNTTTNTYNTKKHAIYRIAARPVIKLDWTNVANPNAVLDFNIGFFSGSNISWTHNTTLTVYLQPTNSISISDLIGPLPVTYVNNAGITTTESYITGVGQTFYTQYEGTYGNRFDRSDATIDLSDYTGIGPVRVVFRAAYQRPYTGINGVGTVVSRPIRLKDIYLRAPLDFVNRSYYHEDTYPPISSLYRRGLYVSGDDPSDHDTFNKFTLHRYGTDYLEDWPGDTLQEWELRRGSQNGATVEEANPGCTSSVYDAPLDDGEAGTVGGNRWYQHHFSRDEGWIEHQTGTENAVIQGSEFYGDFLFHKETFTI